MGHKTYISDIKCILQFVGVIQERGIFSVLFILSSVWLPSGLFIAPCPDAALCLSSCGHCQDITTLLCAPGTVWTLLAGSSSQLTGEALRHRRIRAEKWCPRYYSDCACFRLHNFLLLTIKFHVENRWGFIFSLRLRQSNLSKTTEQIKPRAEFDFRSFCMWLCACHTGCRLYTPTTALLYLQLLSMADALNFSSQLKCQGSLNARFEVLGRGRCHVSPWEVLQFMAEREGKKVRSNEYKLLEINCECMWMKDENAFIQKQMMYVSSFLGFLILVYKAENNVSKQ